ncbi:hypothetical protein AVEN_254063-1 [Araneus ventricosus]|uniref:Uncharacterized protein n=1 Tax=Araneus ventricosus TaxID=182803 RepID=A0A4Y2C086_ARAVE|nr:hypothetical protein AVEN_254063-1 [Araneus ventricosus]
MPSEDKFQYFIQAISPGSPAVGLIESFPPTAQTYPKAIQLLKKRFAGTIVFHFTVIKLTIKGIRLSLKETVFLAETVTRVGVEILSIEETK